MMYGLRRILSRGALTVDDVRILMGIARQALWAAGGSTKDRRNFRRARPPAKRKKRTGTEPD
jgi:tRNA C32,U32 (ribose-2'-O)-methylase TrmJ